MSARSAVAGELTITSPTLKETYATRLERVRCQMAKELEADSSVSGDSGKAVYLPVVYGANARQAESRLRVELKRIGMEMKNVLFADDTLSPPYRHSR